MNQVSKETAQQIIDKVIASDCKIFQSEDYETGKIRLLLKKNRNNFAISRDVSLSEILEAGDPDLLIITIVNDMLEELNKEDYNGL